MVTKVFGEYTDIEEDENTLFTFLLFILLFLRRKFPTEELKLMTWERKTQFEV